MVHIGDTLVSEDVLGRAFCCDLAACHGGCCNSEGESGAPLADDELEAMRAVVPIVWDDLTPRARAVIEAEGPYFRDAAGDWVTSVVDGRDCVFCTYAEGGLCLCAIEKAFREGRLGCLPAYRGGRAPFPKPISCHLYPVRLRTIGDYVAVNYDHQPRLCAGALRQGRRTGVRVYQCVKDALVRRFGQAWYDELELCASELGKAGYLDAVH